MFHSWVESLRFSAWVLPIGFLRLYIGYLYWVIAQDLWSLFQTNPAWLWAWVQNWQRDHLWVLPLTDLLSHKWIFVLVLSVHIGLAVSYFLGYLVRPWSLIGLLVSFIHSQSSQHPGFWNLVFVIHIFLFWIGAGRVMGLDYHFYKHDRGFWW